LARGIAGVAIRSCLRIADEQVEDDRPNNGRDPNRAEHESHTALLEVAHDAARRVEAECTSAGEENRVRALEDSAWAKRLGAERRRRSAANVHAPNSSIRRDDNCAAGAAFRVRPVPDGEAPR
jgi:hypothetical protein